MRDHELKLPAATPGRPWAGGAATPGLPGTAERAAPSRCRSRPGWSMASPPSMGSSHRRREQRLTTSPSLLDADDIGAGPVYKVHEPVPDTRANPVDVPAHDPHSFRLRVVGDRRHWSPAPHSPVERGDSLPEHGRRRAFPRLPLIDDGLPRRAHQRGQLRLAQAARATKRANLHIVVAWHTRPPRRLSSVRRPHLSAIIGAAKLRAGRERCTRAEPAKGGVVARIVTGPHDANRQDPHLPMRYDTGRPRAVIRLRISQPRTASLPCPAGLWARRPSPMMDL